MSRNHTIRMSLCGLAAVAATAVMATVPQAAGITVTFPTILAAGPDYATDVLGDAWDMCNPEDISPFPAELAGFSNFSFQTSPCRAGGTTTLVNGIADSQVSFLYRGWYNVINPGKNGRNFPIDSNAYSVLSYKLSSTLANELPRILFFHSQYQDAVGDIWGGINASTPTVNGAQIAITNLAVPRVQGNADWNNGSVKGFRIDPNSSNVGQNMFFYWVRLTPPNGATQAISWSGGNGTATITVRDNSDGTAYTVASGLSGSSYNWSYGVLPPGSYTLTVAKTDGTNGSSNFKINHPPTIQITDPSPTTGDDFATKVLGNPWDMNDPADIQLVWYDNHTTPTYSGGIATATALNSDPNVNLVNGANDAVPIDTSKYRYMTVRFQLDGPFGLDDANGSVGRLFWGSQPPEIANPTTSLGFLVWPNMNSYTVDLATLTTAPDGGIEPPNATQPSPEPWTSSVMRHLRFDPDEGTNLRTFHIDDVKLTSKPIAAGSYTIKFAGSDLDGDPATVSLYYDTDTNPNNGKTLIASGIPLSAGQYTWSIFNVPLGEYYIYAEAFDGFQTVGRYSTVPLQVTQLARPRANDWDGDGKADIAIFRPSSGLWFTLRSSSNFTQWGTVQWGASGDIPVLGDYDGDGRTDVAVYRPSSGYWFILKSGSNFTTSAVYQWGANGDIPVPGDFDGDGKTDIAVFRPSTGMWFILTSSSNYTAWTAYQWGTSGDVLVPGDYDGDGRTDLAVFRPSNGLWFILQSSTSYQTSRTFQWGTVGDIPVQSDFDGDGKADVAIFRPSSGMWFILKSATNYTVANTYQWGTSGDVPVPRDFDGDGRADIAVFRPASGLWYILNSTNNYQSSSTYQWGTSTDVAPTQY